MNKYIYFIIFSVLLLSNSCVKDLSNIDYQEINALEIRGVNAEYTVRTGMDTLQIAPIIKDSLIDTDADRYDYYWILYVDALNYDTVGREKDLKLPIELNIRDYRLYYRVVDKVTGVSWASNSLLKVASPYSRGILIMGEDEVGYAEAEMLTMLADTIHYKEILSKTNLPRLRDPVSLIHTSGSSESVRVWAMTRSGSYFLDRVSMEGHVENSFNRFLYMSETIADETLHPVVIAPQIRSATGQIGSSYSRVLVTVGGDVFGTSLFSSEYYNNPVNRLASAPEIRLPAAPYLFYPINSMGSSVLWYDLQNNRFMNYNGIGSSLYSLLIQDGANDVFPWNQPVGRTLVHGENTRNTDGGSINGNSFTVMRDEDNTCHIYKFYVGTSGPIKRAAYVVKSIATDFYKADVYAFSSNRTVVFYTVNGKLYAYDYNPGLEKIYTFPEITDPVSMIKFDTQIDHVTNSLYIATYNTTTKGTLTRYLVGTNPNVVEILPQPNSSWSGLVKIKDINWRAAN